MQQRPYPVVVRAASIYPHQIGSYEMHRKRSGGDLGHVDLKRSPRNRILVGDENWAAMVRQKIKEMSEFNFDLCEDKLTRRRRKKELEAHRRMGLTDPWQTSKHGPMREMILTAHKDYFAGDPAKEQGFIALAQEFLVTRFGADLVHARVDLDEEACHIHAIILPVVTDQHGYQMLQPSKHPVIADYEHLQDEVGAWFAPLGLVRGERRAAARREARARGETPPPHRKHVRTSDWRRAEDARLADEHAAQQGREHGLNARTLIQTSREADLNKRKADLDDRKADLDRRSEGLDLRDDKISAREDGIAKREGDLAAREKSNEWIERGLNNLSAAITLAGNGRHKRVITPEDMRDKPKEFAVLQKAAPDGSPTLGFRAEFWALNSSVGSGPAPLPDKIRKSLTDAFATVAAWAGEVSRRKQDLDKQEQELNKQRKQAEAEADARRAGVEALSQGLLDLDGSPEGLSQTDAEAASLRRRILRTPGAWSRLAAMLRPGWDRLRQKARDEVQARQDEVDATLAGARMVAAGFVEEDPYGRIGEVPAAIKASPQLWQELHASWSKLTAAAKGRAEEVRKKFASERQRVKDAAYEDGLAQVLKDHQYVDDVKVFATSLINRLPASERNRATQDLEKAMSGQAKDLEAARRAKTKRKDRGYER